MNLGKGKSELLKCFRSMFGSTSSCRTATVSKLLQAEEWPPHFPDEILVEHESCDSSLQFSDGRRKEKLPPTLGNQSSDLHSHNRSQFHTETRNTCTPVVRAN